MAGSGTLTVSGGTHTYTGTTTVNGGTFSLASTVTLPSSITVNAGAALTGEGTTTGTLAFGSGNTSLTFESRQPLNTSPQTAWISPPQGPSTSHQVPSQRAARMSCSSAAPARSLLETSPSSF